MAKHLAQQIGVAVDIVVFTVEAGRLSVLLTAVKRPPFEGKWALPGGLIASKETLDQAAARELEEKTGLRDVYVEQLYTFSALRRDPAGRVVAVAYLALVPAHGVALSASEKYAGIGWFPTAKLPALAFDHAEMVRYAVQRLRYKLEYTNVAYSLLADAFTLSELQGVYEAILSRPLDPRNFRKRILSLGLVEATGDERRGGAHRPASLYRFTAREPRVVEIL
jgi:8-oxo-dGTP diphosphatase